MITSHRKAIDATEEIDPVTQDVLIEQTETLEQFHWFVRAHLEDAGGHLADSGDHTEKRAAASARRATDSPNPRQRRPRSAASRTMPLQRTRPQLHAQALARALQHRGARARS